jgi:hypothetical protein
VGSGLLRFRAALFSPQMRCSLVFRVALQNLFPGNGEHLADKRVEPLERFRAFNHVFVQQFFHAVIMSRSQN